eukprot:CAMPEP_0206403788 /NCGR_PEP_ID=MMETSP0294-20121207/27933_1 /ASSEMBLY_ACC=CAM_ASM_000327 /TAXON_ID=39354 /ORGANISM="Heterosigma akashiwo, Strain CCMP2393" /LENGTH=64 /DNA_ID=CAMNT_0053861465 /DNA_START=89 /DNA_END=280 /DNA_ORIENTATION=+
MASKLGHAELLKLKYLQKSPMMMTTEALEVAAAHGDIPTAEWMIRNGQKWILETRNNSDLSMSR